MPGHWNTVSVTSAKAIRLPICRPVTVMTGMGFLFIQAVTHVDIPVMAAVLLVVAFTSSRSNTVVDLLYALADPRLRGDVVGGAGGR